MPNNKSVMPLRTTLVDRAKAFLSPAVDYVGEYEKDYATQARDMVNRNYDHLFTQTFNYVRDIPLMLLDPIIASCVELVMESAFQADQDMRILKVSTPYPKIREELDEFHRTRKMGDYALVIGYNQVLYGNLPIRMNYDDNYYLKYFTLVPDFRSIIPLVIGNITIGFQVGTTYHFPYEYVYGQLLYFKDLGGSNALFRFQAKDSEKRINEFVFSPSYLSKAVRPWRSIKIINDALLLQRMDQAHYMRLIKIGVGGGVFSKSAVKILSFYRNLFKKTRRISIDPTSSLSSPSMGGEFELVLPETDTQKVTVDEIGGNVEVKALRDLELKYKELFASLKVRPSMIGFDENEPSSLGDSPVNMWDERFGKTVKTVQYSTARTIKQIDVLYLRSKGYDVTDDDFQIHFSSPSNVDDEKKRLTLSVSTKTMSEIVGNFDAVGIPYDKKYLTKTLYDTLLSNSVELDFDTLFQNPSEAQEKITAKMSLLSSHSETSLLPADLVESLAYNVDLGLLTQSELEAFGASPKREQITSGQEGFKQSYGVVKYDKFLSSVDVYSAIDVPVDLAPYVGTKKIIKANFEIKDTGITLPIGSIITSKNTVKSTDLLKGTISEIENAYLVDSHIYLEGEDLINYLYMADLGYKHFMVKNYYQLKE